MCGIAGIYSSTPISETVVLRMLDAIGYRGPDHREAKAYTSAAGSCLTVGQARLAVIDVNPEANQPFESGDGQSCLTFNGEFYNFQPLRQALSREGVSFCTQSDTEVALALFDSQGPGALEQLWGMFAGAHYRCDTGTLLLFRDRFGKKTAIHLPSSEPPVLRL